MDLKKKFVSNLSHAFIAQLVAMVISMGVNLVLPKFVGVESYSYWQLFIFYSQYIPFLHLGLNDGVYLRYGGITFSEMNQSKIKSQMLLGFVYQFVFCVILCIVSYIFIYDQTRVMIIILTCIYFLVYTVQNYLGYIFQAANETSWYSKSIILNRLSFLILMIVCLFQKLYDCWPYIMAYIIAQIIAAVYSGLKGRKILSAKIGTLKETTAELVESIWVGNKLMLANIASMLILGIGRQFIDMKWGILEFGKISFAITLTNFILTFIQQIGMVMFPMLRQLKGDRQKQVYEICRIGMFFILPIIFIGYFPLRLILSVWLPGYEESLRYLALLLPICFFDTKMQMLFNTYLKVQRKEKLLFRINMIAMLISLCMSTIGVFVVQQLNVVVIGMVVAIAIRSLIAEFYLSRSMGISVFNSVAQEIIVVSIFMGVTWFLTVGVGTLVMSIIYLILIGINYRVFISWKHQVGFIIKKIDC